MPTAEQEVAYGFNLLLVDELAKEMSPSRGWRVSDLGCAAELPVASLLVDATVDNSPSGFEYRLHLHNDNENGLFGRVPTRLVYNSTHLFRVDLCYIARAGSKKVPILVNRLFEMYSDHPILMATLFFSDNPFAIRSWKPGERGRGNYVVKVCPAIVYPVEHPSADVELARKIYTAMGSYLLTKQHLLPH